MQERENIGSTEINHGEGVLTPVGNKGKQVKVASHETGRKIYTQIIGVVMRNKFEVLQQSNIVVPKHILPDVG